MENNEMYERILDKLDDIKSELGSKIDASNEKNERERGKLWDESKKHNTSLAVLNKEVYGNGKRGLVERIENIERSAVFRDEFEIFKGRCIDMYKKTMEKAEQSEEKADENSAWINAKNAQLGLLLLLSTGIGAIVFFILDKII